MKIADLRQRVGTATAIILGVMLLALTCITVMDVTGRYLLNAPLPGGAELTELLVMAVIFAGLPALSLDDGHVTADLLSHQLGPTGRAVQLFAARACAVVALVLIAKQMWEHGARLTGYGQTTVYLHIPVGPVVQAASVVCAVSAVIVAALAVTRAPQGG
ncbi:TRAP transporter small permease [Paracoccus aurantiacus]|uniref:TRAP transporter small permease protein n=1 Tax=Paracoccus aurantiacus TaxID=2599412 RepID=A0A5C6RZZ6_9RHOB|nr:TRAP transporter small permease [Paracoccus aurantiacus]TXB67704.1 TRAP transporter small permease [Paracoccus aurantiacus]